MDKTPQMIPAPKFKVGDWASTDRRGVPCQITKRDWAEWRGCWQYAGEAPDGHTKFAVYYEAGLHRRRAPKQEAPQDGKV